MKIVYFEGFRKIIKLKLKMIKVPESLMCIRAKPDNNSSAASDTFKSVFHDEINR
jgi:hypothetical protein